MKKRNITLIVLILIFITATYYVLSRKDSEDQELKNDVVIENNLEREEKPKETKEVVSKVNADIAIGNEAPNFTLKNLEGEEISLEDYLYFQFISLKVIFKLLWRRNLIINILIEAINFKFI